jgi:hypothetical protein
VKEANGFLASGDPYLSLRADKTTPPALAKRFLDACDATSGSVASATSLYSGLEPVAPVQSAPKSPSDDLSKPSKQGGRFLEIHGEVNTTTFDLSTAQILQPRRFSVVSTTIGFPWMMKFELNAFDTLRTYCARPAGKFPTPVDLLTLGPADMPASEIKVQGGGARKFVTWSYPYRRLAQRSAFVVCEAQDQLSQRVRITNGHQQKMLFDCGQGLAGSFFDSIDNGDPSKVLTQAVRPNTNLEEHYVRVCDAVLHEWPYLPDRPASAQVEVGVAYEFGWGSGRARDYVEAAKWYRKAAEQGFAKGQAQLASLYAFGRGVQRDHVEAAKWYRLAADQGDGDAQLSLGIMYHNGTGVPKDNTQAYKWIMLALARFPNSGGVEAMQHDNCIQWRDKVATEMTPPQIVEAQRLTAEWRPATSKK